MEIYAVTAVRFFGGKLVALKMGRVDGASNTWVQQPEEVAVLRVVDELMASNRITTIFRHEGYEVPGPFLRVVSDQNGEETVVPEGELKPGYHLEDLPRF